MKQAPWQPVLQFWFGDSPDDAEVSRRKSRLWWGGGHALDTLVRERFGLLRQQATAGQLDWAGTPESWLALLILVDQFSRNIFRGDPRAYEQDPLARRWAQEGLDQGRDTQLRPIQRVFCYLPFEHSENLADQQRGVALNEALASSVPANQREIFENFARYARAHRDIVARFGRFPHRNKVLGRPSTEEELEFLKQPGSSF
jgi:uncharacterized protein (DUF924 family)